MYRKNIVVNTLHWPNLFPVEYATTSFQNGHLLHSYYVLSVFLNMQQYFNVRHKPPRISCSIWSATRPRLRPELGKLHVKKCLKIFLNGRVFQ